MSASLFIWSTHCNSLSSLSYTSPVAPQSTLPGSLPLSSGHQYLSRCNHSQSHHYVLGTKCLHHICLLQNPYIVGCLLDVHAIGLQRSWCHTVPFQALQSFQLPHALLCWTLLLNDDAVLFHWMEAISLVWLATSRYLYVERDRRCAWKVSDGGLRAGAPLFVFTCALSLVTSHAWNGI